MKKLMFILLLSTTFTDVWAQEVQDNEQRTQETVHPTQAEQKQVHKGHPKELKSTSVMPLNYGSMVIDWGFNFLRDCPSEIDAKNWKARFVNLGLYYNIRLGHSHFTMTPGIGLSFEEYRLKEGHVLERNATDTVLKLHSDPSNVLLSALSVRYIDFAMLEVRFNANSKWPKESFFVAIGGKVGYLWKACATVQYKEHNEKKQCNNWENFHLNGIRYGTHVRIGWGRFGLCYTQIFSDLFKEGKGPEKTTTKSCNLGLSIDLF